MITQDGWFDFAERVPGLTSKVSGWANPVKGFIGHSAEGWEQYLRDVQQRPTPRSSWHLSNLIDGRLMQHYPLNAQCWASGSGYPNDNLIAMESEGMAGTPLTDAQCATAARVITELSAAYGWVPERLVTIWEHREATRWGSLPTACPSDRYPWDKILSLIGDDELSDLEKAIGKELWRKSVAAHNLTNVWRIEEGPYDALVITDAAGVKHTLAAEVPAWLVEGQTPLA